MNNSLHAREKKKGNPGCFCTCQMAGIFRGRCIKGFNWCEIIRSRKHCKRYQSFLSSAGPERQHLSDRGGSHDVNLGIVLCESELMMWKSCDILTLPHPLAYCCNMLTDGVAQTQEKCLHQAIWKMNAKHKKGLICRCEAMSWNLRQNPEHHN